MDESLLERIGLTKGEIRVYLALLKLGETTTGKIIEEADMSSGKIYEILDKLMKKGLASNIIKEKTKYFSAASPNRIIDYLREKEKELKKQEEAIAKELPTMLAIEKAGRKEHETKLFKGFKGIQTAIFEAVEEMTSEDEVLAMGVRSSKEKQYNILWQRWHKERIKKKIRCKTIFSDKDTEYYKTFSKMRFMRTRTLQGITPSAIDVMKDKVLIFTYGEEPSCLMIKNPEIAQSFTSFFNNLWGMAKK